MDTPIMLDKPPEYYKKVENGFPFDEEEGSDAAWNDLSSRHPDIAARLRNRAGWGNKRRPSNSNPNEFPAGFGNRFPFEDIPAEFREHFPSHWSQRFATPQSQQPPPPAQHNRYPQYEHQYSQPASKQPQPQKCTIATQTSVEDIPELNKSEQTQAQPEPQPNQDNLQPQQIPQHGLRNTVDLGQKTPTDPSVDADRNQRAMSAPPDNRPGQAEDQGTVRHIPIFVEGRDEPIINKNVDASTNFGGEHRSPRYTPSPDREQYFDREIPSNFRAPPHFARGFGTPFRQGGTQPFAQQKVFPQNAYKQERGRSQSPKPQNQQQNAQQHTPPPPQQQQNQQQQTPPQKPQQQQPPPQKPQPDPQPAPSANDPITKILGIQKEVLDLMNDVENFVGCKKDKRYLYLDEMLTRNLIKLDDIDTEGKENIRQARKEAIKCIQKCISVLEAKADSQNQNAQAPKSPADVEMTNEEKPAEEVSNKDENAGGDIKMETKEPNDAVIAQENKVDEAKEGSNDAESDEKAQMSVKEKIQALNSKTDEPKKEAKKTTKKGGKKRDKSKDAKNEKGDGATMQVDDKIESTQPNGQQPMEVDANAPAASQ